jgi:hypothetical protein
MFSLCKLALRGVLFGVLDLAFLTMGLGVVFAGCVAVAECCTLVERCLVCAVRP